MQLQTGNTVKKEERHWTFIKMVYRNSRNTSSKGAFVHLQFSESQYTVSTL